MYICSDTNVWIDFAEIGKVDLPFRLSYKYYISKFALAEEVLRPATLKKTLLTLGLKATTLTIEEFTQAKHFMLRFKKLSVHDAMALSVAKTRGWILLTGDKQLFKAAEELGVEWHGTLWIFDQLLKEGKLTSTEYLNAMGILLKAIKDKKCWLPKEKVKERIKEVCHSPDKVNGLCSFY